jgi:hypothetical protein
MWRHPTVKLFICSQQKVSLFESIMTVQLNNNDDTLMEQSAVQARGLIQGAWAMHVSL